MTTDEILKKVRKKVKKDSYVSITYDVMQHNEGGELNTTCSIHTLDNPIIDAPTFKRAYKKFLAILIESKRGKETEEAQSEL